jgi:predicted RNA-binding Zn-ribbon protein involved in translation (DUF1610 family)
MKQDYMNFGAPKEIGLGTGAHGWPLAPSKRFPGETTLSCPACGSVNITLGVEYPRYGTGSKGQGRLGDRGAMDYVKCEECGKTDWKAAKEMGR